MKSIVKTTIFLIVLLSAGLANAQIFSEKGSSYYSDNYDLNRARESALYNAAINAVINSGSWCIKDANNHRLYNASQIKSDNAYFLYNYKNRSYEYMTKESVFSKVIIAGGPEYRYRKSNCMNYVIAEADFSIPNKARNAVNSKSKMRSYIGIGSIGYCWNLWPENINSQYWYKHLNKNGIYATLGRFKFGSKFFAVTMDLASYEQNSNFQATYTNTGNYNGENALDSMSAANGNYTLKLQRLSFVKLGWQYDIHLYLRHYHHFCPYRFTVSPFISTAPVEWNIVKMPFSYYDETDHRFIKHHTGETTTFWDYFKTFETGLKIKSSLYELIIGYNWRYGTKDFIQNYGEGDFGPNTKLSSKQLNLEHGYFFVKFGICFDWNTRNFRDF
jgi:hypothetical protein